MTITEFLQARLDEDEAAAKAVAPLGHVFDMGGNRLNEQFSHARLRWASEDGRSWIEGDVAAGRHFARHDPARVLREVEAGREILAMYADAVAEASPEVVEWMLAVVETEARIFSDHPDYQQDWA